jgi:5-oxoprolinase (ATP-hydrolysing)
MTAEWDRFGTAGPDLADAGEEEVSRNWRRTVRHVAAGIRPVSWQFWIDRGGTFTDIVARTGRAADPDQTAVGEPACLPGCGIAGIRASWDWRPKEPIGRGLIESVKMGTTVGTNALLTHSRRPGPAGHHRRLRRRAGNRRSGPAGHLRPGYPQTRALVRRVIEGNERMAADGACCRRWTGMQPARRLASRPRRRLSPPAPSPSCMPGKTRPTSWRPAKRRGPPVSDQISLSHQASPLIKFVPGPKRRCWTPPCRRRCGAMWNRWRTPCRRTRGWNSCNPTAACADADHFQGKDSVLSGPAGGLIGMAKVGRAAGFDKLIGFDMGGTSTDVSLFSGEFERSPGHPHRRPPHPRAHAGGPYRGGGWRFHPAFRRPTPVGRTGIRRQPARAGQLSARRPADGDRRQPAAGSSPGRLFPRRVRAGRRSPLDLETVRNAFRSHDHQREHRLGLDYSPERLAAGFWISPSNTWPTPSATSPWPGASIRPTSPWSASAAPAASMPAPWPEGWASASADLAVCLRALGLWHRPGGTARAVERLSPLARRCGGTAL